jgi:TPR repeat protein
MIDNKLKPQPWAKCLLILLLSVILLCSLLLPACALEDTISEDMRRDSERGDMEAEMNYNLRTREPSPKPNFQTINPQDKPDSTKVDDPEELYNSGLNYARGEYVKQDYYQAFSLFNKAAKANHPSAQYELANLYNLGNGTKKNLSQAYYWMYISAHNANPDAKLALHKLGLLLKSKEKEEMKELADKWLKDK